MYTTPTEIRNVYPWPERIELIDGIINDVEDLLRAGYDSVVRGMVSNSNIGVTCGAARVRPRAWKGRITIPGNTDKEN